MGGYPFSLTKVSKQMTEIYTQDIILYMINWYLGGGKVCSGIVRPKLLRTW
jgi:hypothetical protein